MYAEPDWNRPIVAIQWQQDSDESNLWKHGIKSLCDNIKIGTRFARMGSL